MMMMNKKRTSKLQLGKYLFLLPVFILIEAGFTVSKTENKMKSLTDQVQQTQWKMEFPFSSTSMTAIQEKKPLIVIDGKEANDDALQALDPNTIESINVLKDKPATEQYGEKGKNGVIEVTLKKKAESINHADRLYLMDGQESTAEEVENTDPDQIESIQVIKDPKQVAEYGVPGKKSVINIERKQKKE